LPELGDALVSVMVSPRVIPTVFSYDLAENGIE
jgi:hypothetical protein